MAERAEVPPGANPFVAALVALFLFFQAFLSVSISSSQPIWPQGGFLFVAQDFSSLAQPVGRDFLVFRSTSISRP